MANMTQKTFTAKVTNLVQSVRSVEKESQALVIASASHYFKSGDTVFFKILFEALYEVGGSFRHAELIGYSAQKVGLKVAAEKNENNDDSGKYSVKKDKEVTIDPAAAMEDIKANPWFKWAKPANLSRAQFQDGWLITMAKAVMIGEATLGDLQDTFAPKLVRKVVELTSDKKVVEYASNWIGQELGTEDQDLISARINAILDDSGVSLAAELAAPVQQQPEAIEVKGNVSQFDNPADLAGNVVLGADAMPEFLQAKVS